MKLQKLINFIWRLIYGEWDEARQAELFSRFATIFDFQTWLVSNGFKWRSDGLNFSIETDTFERPGQVLARGWANCGGFMRLFEAYIKATGAVDEYVQFELTAPAKILGVIPWTRWHYVSAFRIGAWWYVQSNLAFLAIVNEADTESMIRLFKEYQNARVLDRWTL